MAKSFDDLFKKTTNFDKLADQVGNGGKKKDYKDDRVWKPTPGKDGSARAVFRFLPEPDGEEMPFVKMHSHSFKVKGQWFIENCPTTIHGEGSCPVCNENKELYITKDPENKKIAQPRNRRTKYTSNIYIISDPGNPANEGKVFLFEYGESIMNKIFAAAKPEFPEDPKIFAFSFIEGASFKFSRKIDGAKKMADGSPSITYENSTFDVQSEFLGGDREAIMEVYKKAYSLAEIISPDKFKTFDELDKRFKDVYKTRGPMSQSIEDQINEAETTTKETSRPSVEAKTSPAKEEEDDIPDFSGADDDDINSILDSLEDE